MQFVFYPLLCLSLLGHFFLGYIVTKKNYYALPVGLLLSGSIIAILSRIIPIYTLEIISITLIISTIIFFYKRLYLEVLNDIDPKKLLYLFISLIIFSLIFFKFHYRFTVYQSHESFYFAPSIELYLSEYYGNLRSLSYYPSNLTGHPIFPSSVLSALSVFVDEINLVKILEARYILIVLFFSIISLFYFNKNNRTYLNLLVFLLVLYFYDNLISHSLLHSDIIGLFCFAFLIIAIIDKSENSIRSGSYLSLLILVTKPGIIFIFLIFPAYFYIFFKSVRKDIIFYLIAFVIFLNCFSWIALETPFGNSKISLFNPFELRDYFYTLISANWFNNSLFFDYINNLQNISVYSFEFESTNLNLLQKIEFFRENYIKIIIDIFEIILNLFITFFLSYYLILKNSSINKKNIFFIFLIISFLVFCFLRNENIFGNKTMEQSVHIIHFISILPLILIPIFNIEKPNKKLSSVILILFLLNINFDIVYGDNEFKNRIKSKEYVEYNNLNFLELNSEINFTLSEKKIFNINDLRTEELKSLLYGKRILRDEYNVFSNAIRPHIITWTYPRLHDYYWSNSLITDHSSNKLLHIKFLEEKFSW
tara:strand:- start:777 stop:2558 length:1782 start_codon:yes stop_codon:yes gene_type:complete